ncbi:MAG: Clp protease N-terminal domain-containing protein [Alistipes sp.]|nr:Clp protease N-terminal domain-containing protein [Alistipes sp.]
MTKSKISNALMVIMTRTAEELTKNGTKHSYKDYLVASILENDATMAHTTLTMLMQEWQIRSLATAIRNKASESSIEEIVSAEHYFESLCNFLDRAIDTRRISTVHILYAAAADPSSATSRLLHNYGINAEDILTAIARLTGEESNERTVTKESTTRDIALCVENSDGRVEFNVSLAMGDSVSLTLGDSRIELCA